MIKQNQIELKQKLKNIIKEIGHMNEVKQELGKEFISRNLSAYRVINVFMGNEDLDTLTDSDDDIRFLFLFAFTLNKILKEKNIELSIDVQDYFTQIEYREWKDYKGESQPEKIYPIIIENIQQVGDKIWQTIMTAQQLNQLDADNLLIYNFKTQRNPKITVSGEQINVDKQKVNEIKERLISGEQFPDPIILNILNNGESRISYNDKNNTLVIYEGSIINIVDGFHRKTANSLAIEINPDLQFNWQVTLTFLTETMAHDYMVQKDKQKPIKKEWIKQKDYTKPENLVVDVINDDKLSGLAKVMKEDDAYIKLNKALTKKSVISQAIKECYEEELSVSTNIRSIGKWIVEFTDYLFSLYPEEFIVNPYQVKEHSLINHKNMFYGYIALSAELRDNNQWKDITKKKLESIDFNKDNQLWRDLGLIDNKDANKSLRKKLYNLFTGGLR